MTVAQLPPFAIEVYSPLILGGDLYQWWTGRYPELVTTPGGPVSALADVKTGNPLGQGMSGAQPVNDGPAINFDGFDDCLSAESIFGLPITDFSEGLEVWARVRQDALASDTGARLIVSYGAGNSSALRFGRAVVGGQNRARALIGTGSGVTALDNTSVDLSGNHTLRLRLTPFTAILEVDGNPGSGAQAIAASFAAGRLRFGASQAGVPGNFWEGGASDLLFTKAQTPARAAQMYQFLEG